MKKIIVDIEDDDKFIKTSEEIERDKELLVKSLFENWDEYLQSIKIKQDNENLEKQNRIDFILKKVKNKYGDVEYLNSLSFEDLSEVYFSIKNRKETFFKKLFSIFKDDNEIE